MAYIYMNVDGLQKFIYRLKERGEAYKQISVDTRSTWSAHNEQTEIGDMVGDETTTWTQAHELVTEAEEELQVRLNEAVRLSENGIGMCGPYGTVYTPGADGMVCYYLPDGAADTVANVQSYNSQAADNGRQDATSLNQALNSEDGKARDGRTVEEILAEMERHQDVPAYGAIYVRTFGADRYLDLPARVANYYSKFDPGTKDEEFLTARETLGHVMAAASQDEAGGSELAFEVNNVVTTDVDQGRGGKVDGLNLLLTAPGAVYGTNFLVSTGESMEKIDPGKIPQYGIPTNYYLTKYGVPGDPLIGVATAMGSNPEAAVLYMTPDWKDGKPGQRSQDRWEMLTQRLDPGTRWYSGSGREARGEALSALTAAASSYRGGGDAEGAPADAGARATWVAGQAVPFFVDKVPEDNYTETMKQNLAVLAASCSQEYASLAYKGSLAKTGLDGKVSRQHLDTLLYRIIDNENAAATVAAGMGDWHHNQTETEMASAKENENDPAKVLQDQYEYAAATMAYLNGIADKRAGDDKDAQEDARENMGTALSVFSTVLGAGATAVTAGAASPVVAAGVPLATDVGTTIAQPIIADEVTKGWDVPDTVKEGDITTMLRAQSYLDAARWDAKGGKYDGLLQDSTMEAAKPYFFYSQDRNGNPVITEEPLTPDQATTVLNWEDAVVETEGAEPTMTALEGAVNDGWDTGSRRAGSAQIRK